MRQNKVDRIIDQTERMQNARIDMMLDTLHREHVDKELSKESDGNDPCKGLVAGDYMTKSLHDYLRCAATIIKDEQAKPRPDNNLIDFACEAVRLLRETR